MIYMMSLLRNKKWASTIAILMIMVVAFGFYGMTLRGVVGNPSPEDFSGKLDQPTQPFELSPERGRFAHIMALSDDGRYDLSNSLMEAAYPDVGFKDGKFYSFFAPGLAYLAVPFYQFGALYDLSQVATFAFISMMSILALIFLFKIAHTILKLPIWISLLSVLIFAFGSTAWSYAISLYQHQVTTLFLLASFYAVWKYRQRVKTSWLWGLFVWFNFGLGMAIDYPNVILLAPIIVYFLISSISIHTDTVNTRFSLRLAFIMTSFVFIGISGLHALHNQTNFGSWATLSGSLPTYVRMEAQSTLAATSQGKDIIAFFSEENLLHGFYTLLFSPDRGLFIFAPIFLLAFVGLYYVWAKNKFNLELGILTSILVVHVFLYSSWGDPWGGWAYGPRYLIPSMAVLALFIGLGIQHARQQLAMKLIAISLFAYSSAVALLGALTTNAVPPKLQAETLENLYNYILNVRFLRQNESSSFVYNTYLADALSLPALYGVMLFSLLALAILVIFIISRYEHET